MRIDRVKPVRGGIVCALRAPEVDIHPILCLENRLEWTVV